MMMMVGAWLVSLTAAGSTPFAVRPRMVDAALGARDLWWDATHAVELAPGVTPPGGRYEVLRLAPGTALLERLEATGRALVVVPPTARSSGFAVLRDLPAELRLELLLAAHDETGSCGAIETIDLEPPPITERSFAAAAVVPVHDESVRLREVMGLVGAVEAARLADTVATLEALGSRRQDLASGIATPDTIAELACEAIGASAPCSSLALERVTHTSTEQASLVVRIPGALPSEPTVILGAHLDSVNAQGGAAPGADDDATGVASLLEVLRVLHETGATFEKSIELHFYAAEEFGLWGSAEIAARYRAQSRPVHAMMQLDMNGYGKDGDSKIYFVTNDTTLQLNTSLGKLVDTYLGGGHQQVSFTLGSSDHRSWYKQGYAAAFPFEHPVHHNPNVHTSADTSALLTPALVARHVRLAVAFLAHHAGLVLAPRGDLKLAVLRSTTDATRYDVSVATSPGPAKVELCLATQPGLDERCAEPAVTMTLEATRDGRAFFVTPAASPVALSVGLPVLLRAVDSGGATLGTTRTAWTGP